MISIIGSVFAFGGCSANTETDEIGIDAIYLLSASESEVEVDLQIDSAGERLYERRHTLLPESENDETVLELPGFEQKREYAVTASTGSGSAVSRTTDGLAETRETFSRYDCVDFVVYVRSESSIAIYTGFHEECGDDSDRIQSGTETASRSNSLSPVDSRKSAAVAARTRPPRASGLSRD